ncbi:hypothetical protein EMIT0P294_140037 [Pseudomonas sp. IT-P294]
MDSKGCMSIPSIRVPAPWGWVSREGFGNFHTNLSKPAAEARNEGVRRAIGAIVQSARAGDCPQYWG